MRTISSLFVVALTVGAFACGGGGASTGGVSGSKKLSELTVADAIALCDANKDSYDSKITTCPGEDPEERGSDPNEDCSDATPPTVNASCTATVGDLVDCADALYDATDAQYCDDSYLPSECEPLFSCFGSARTASDIRSFALAARAVSAR